MTELLTRFVRDTEGQDLIEYALLAALVSISSLAAMNTLAGALNTYWGTRVAEPLVEAL